MNCYNCGRPFGEHETVEMSQKYMDDNKLSTWYGKRDYPNGLCHIHCGRLYANGQDSGAGRGGRKSKRVLTKEQAKEMVRKREEKKHGQQRSA